MKSPREISLAALGHTSWFPHDTWQTPTGITLGGFVSSGATLTWAVQYTLDDIYDRRLVNISQAASVTATITDSGPPERLGTHGLSVGDWIKIEGSGIGIDGEYDVASIVDSTHYTITTAINQTKSVSSIPLASARVFTHDVLTAQTARKVSNYNLPVKASRLQITAYTSGVASLDVLQGGMST